MRGLRTVRTMSTRENEIKVNNLLIQCDVPAVQPVSQENELLLASLGSSMQGLGMKQEWC